MFFMTQDKFGFTFGDAKVGHCGVSFGIIPENSPKLRLSIELVLNFSHVFALKNTYHQKNK